MKFATLLKITFETGYRFNAVNFIHIENFANSVKDTSRTDFKQSFYASMVVVDQIYEKLFNHKQLFPTFVPLYPLSRLTPDYGMKMASGTIK